MKKVSKQTAGTIGLVTAILYIIGNVVGVGIFFKNNTVFNLNNTNAIGILVSWIVSIIIVMCMALSFAEISTCKLKNKNAGIGGWVEQFCGKKFGRYAKIGFLYAFWPLQTFTVMFFSGEAIINCFIPLTKSSWSAISKYDLGYGTTAIVFGVGMALFIFFLFTNYFASKTMGKVGSIISLIKFLPILMVVVFGIWIGIQYNDFGAWKSITEQSNVNNKIVPMGIITSIPAILFSFEGYISVGSISGDIKNPEKNLSLSVILGVIIISILYLAITIGCITSGKGDVYAIFAGIKEKTKPEIYKSLTSLISIFILICLIGCVNGFTKGGISAFKASAEENIIFNSRHLINKFHGNSMLAGTIYFVIGVLFWWAILIIPSAILNVDAIADGSSTAMIVFLYVIYSITVVAGFINRKTQKVHVNKITIFPVASFIGALGCIFMIVFVGFVQFIFAPIMAGLNNLDGENSWQGIKAGWGMFVNAKNCLGLGKDGIYKLSNIETMIWFWSILFIIFMTPFVNELLIKRFDKTNNLPLFWQKQ